MLITKRRLVLTGLVLAGLLLAPACNRTSEKLQPVVLGIEDNGGQVEVAAGREVILRLAAHPRPGYGWQLVQLDESLLQMQGDPQFENSDPGDLSLVGINGWEVFRFVPSGAGEVELELGYRRP